MISIRPLVSLLAALPLLFAIAPLGLRAQVGPGAPSDNGWAPPSIGVRLGWDNKQQDEVLGAQVRIPVIPSGEVELMGSADVTFLRNLKEYEYNIEAVYVNGGRAGGLYAGGGLGLRNTIYDDSGERRTELGYTAVAGIRFVGLGRVTPQFEVRWIFIDEAPFTYQHFSVGINLPLWRPVDRN